MSRQHPIIAVTGSSGAGTTQVKTAFERICTKERLKPAIIEGDSYHRFDRAQMEAAVAEAAARGEQITHFGPAGNLFDELEETFRRYGENGTGRVRRYVHTEAEAEETGCPPGTFTPWEELPPDTDLLLYEGLHGGLVTGEVNIARQVDLLIGVVPVINLEWIQKICRDRAERGYSAEAATDMILRRMRDYVHYITPQFSRTHINFQRIPTIDTANPFIYERIPNEAESAVIVHVQDTGIIEARFDDLLEALDGSFMSGPDTMLVPGTQYTRAMEIIIYPVIERLMRARQA